MKKEIMKRAWEIKKEADRRSFNRVLRNEPKREKLYAEEKAIFAICLKMAWDEMKKANKISEKYQITEENGLAIAKAETELKALHVGTISWRIWKNYGKCRQRCMFRIGKTKMEGADNVCA